MVRVIFIYTQKNKYAEMFIIETKKDKDPIIRFENKEYFHSKLFNYY
jgi:hypothetical protein